MNPECCTQRILVIYEGFTLTHTFLCCLWHTVVTLMFFHSPWKSVSMSDSILFSNQTLAITKPECVWVLLDSVTHFRKAYKHFLLNSYLQPLIYLILLYQLCPSPLCVCVSSLLMSLSWFCSVFLCDFRLLCAAEQELAVNQLLLSQAVKL